MAKKKTFRWRGMVTLFLLIVLVVDAASGIILYISPAGSIARWSSWVFWGLNKEQWESIHIVFSLMLLLILAGHVYFNWRMLTHFIWDKMRQVVTLKKELAGAFVITILIFTGTLWNIQPLKALTDFRETMKRSGRAGFVAGQGRGYGNTLSAEEHQRQLPGSSNQQQSFGRSGQGRGFGNRLPGGEHQSQPPGSNNQQNYLRNNPYNQQQPIGRGGGRGGGFGRNAYAGQTQPNNLHPEASQLKGRDYVRLGNLETHSGTLVRLNQEEWGLKVGSRVFEIHMGPSEYRAFKGFTLKEGESANISGYVYQNNLSVKTMETGGQSITLRNENGQPVWAGSGFSRGGGRSSGYTMNGSIYHTEERI